MTFPLAPRSGWALSYASAAPSVVPATVTVGTGALFTVLDTETLPMVLCHLYNHRPVMLGMVTEFPQSFQLVSGAGIQALAGWLLPQRVPNHRPLLSPKTVRLIPGSTLGSKGTSSQLSCSKVKLAYQLNTIVVAQGNSQVCVREKKSSLSS